MQFVLSIAVLLSWLSLASAQTSAQADAFSLDAATQSQRPIQSSDIEGDNDGRFYSPLSTHRSHVDSSEKKTSYSRESSNSRAILTPHHTWLLSLAEQQRFYAFADRPSAPRAPPRSC